MNFIYELFTQIDVKVFNHARFFGKEIEILSIKSVHKLRQFQKFCQFKYKRYESKIKV